MDDYKNIDRLFQEKLKSLETIPSPEVWDTIEAKLQKKKKRRILPFWWYSGIAGVLIIGILVFSLNKSEPNEIFKNVPVIVEERKEENKKMIFKNIPQIEEDTLQTEMVYKENNDLKILENKKGKRTETKFKKVKNVIALVKEREKKESNNGLLSDKKNAMEKIFTRKENEILAIKTDSVFKQEKKKNFLAEVNKIDSIKEVKSIDKKWSIIPTVAIINSNSFSNSSPLDQSLASNTSGDNSVSYGVRVDYKLNNKWSLQAGFFKRSLDFSTNNLSIVSNVSGSNFNNINYDSDVSFLIINNEISSNSPILNGAIIVEENVNLLQTFGYVEVPIEVKYTLINKRKFNTKLVSGFSTLFLNDNTISLKTLNTSKSIGKATNLNSINFSGNLGIDFNYSLNNKLNFNITPMFKVQMNTFSNKANGFQPYTIGIYSGLSYKF